MCCHIYYLLVSPTRLPPPSSTFIRPAVVYLLTSCLPSGPSHSSLTWRGALPHSCSHLNSNSRFYKPRHTVKHHTADGTRPKCVRAAVQRCSRWRGVTQLDMRGARYRIYQGNTATFIETSASRNLGWRLFETLKGLVTLILIESVF